MTEYNVALVPLGTLSGDGYSALRAHFRERGWGIYYTYRKPGDGLVLTRQLGAEESKAAHFCSVIVALHTLPFGPAWPDMWLVERYGVEGPTAPVIATTRPHVSVVGITPPGTKEIVVDGETHTFKTKAEVEAFFQEQWSH